MNATTAVVQQCRDDHWHHSMALPWHCSDLGCVHDSMY
jgi:hypothetical protein